MTPEIVGLIPAAGQATRIAPLPCSKEIYPIGFREVEDGSRRPKVVGHYLLEKMRLAGVSKVFIILREGKWDIPAYFGDGHWLNLDLAYLMMRLPYGAPYTLDQAYPFTKAATILFGFPDILFEPQDAFMQLLAQQKRAGAELVLGLFPAENPQKMDMVETDEAGRVRRIEIKPPQTDLAYTWIIAVWTPLFSRYMHHYLLAAQASAPADRTPPELYVGHVVQAAIDDGLRVDSVRFSAGRCLDIGTPDSLVRIQSEEFP